MKSGTCELVRDLFIFSVFTGLAYADVKALTTDRLQTFFDGNLWIITRRRKTNTESNIRLLDVPRRIIEMNLLQAPPFLCSFVRQNDSSL